MFPLLLLWGKLWFGTHHDCGDIKGFTAGLDFKLQNEILTSQLHPVSVQPPQSGCEGL